ncbi:MAG TPA: GNAT family N-acetyltransferase, partial [Nitrolancea sp.]|nr:GNAT family N-acetyltransferase [Nitrolancea sp.]
DYAARPIGYIQIYLIEDYPDYAQFVGADEQAAGVDLFIGEIDCIHRGLGPVLLKRFLCDLVFVRPDVTSCVIGPAISNVIAIRAYEKAGFRYFKTASIPDEDEPEYLMRIGRDAVLAQ